MGRIDRTYSEGRPLNNLAYCKYAHNTNNILGRRSLCGSWSVYAEDDDDPSAVDALVDEAPPDSLGVTKPLSDPKKFSRVNTKQSINAADG